MTWRTKRIVLPLLPPLEERAGERRAILVRVSPLWGRGRVVSRAGASPERLDSLQRVIRSSLSLRERARVRGNETPPTKTVGRIFLGKRSRSRPTVNPTKSNQITQAEKKSGNLS